MSNRNPELPVGPWTHIGDCPICGEGLCRLRCCTAMKGQKTLYALCEQCEAIWMQPDTGGEYRVTDVDPICPVCGGALYGPCSRWATTEDVHNTPWESSTIVDLPMSLCEEGDAISPDSSPNAPFVTHEDQASALDVPSTGLPGGTKKATEESKFTDWAYGQDEPRPGC